MKDEFYGVVALVRRGVHPLVLGVYTPVPLKCTPFGGWGVHPAEHLSAGLCRPRWSYGMALLRKRLLGLSPVFDP